MEEMTETEFWQIQKEEFKKRCEKRNNNYEPKLLELGAIKKSDAVYEYDGWFCYPTKGFAMEKKNTQNRMGLDSFIKSRSDNTEHFLQIATNALKRTQIALQYCGYDENLRKTALDIEQTLNQIKERRE